MTADELDGFLTYVRAEAARRLARLDTIDPDRLSPELRGAYERMRADWMALLEMTEDEAVALHLAAVEHAGRELTADELRGLLSRQ